MISSLRIFLLISLIAFGSAANAQEQESSYCLLRSKADPNLMPGQSSFRIHVANEKGNVTKEILVVDNGVERHLWPDEKGYVTLVTTPGKHAITFVLGDEYYPIITDTLFAVENYQIIMEVMFKSSVLITFKERPKKK